MSNIQVKGIYPYSWSNANHGEYMKMVDDRLSAATLPGTKLPAALAAFKAARAVEDRYFIQSRASALTPEIKAADDLQDEGVTGLRALANAYARFPDAEKSEAARKVLALFKLYKISVSEQMAREAYKVENFLQDADKTEAKAAVAAIDGTRFVEMMREGSQKVHQLLGDRNTEQSTRVAQALKKARAATDEAYHTLIALVNAAALLSETDELDSLVRQLNQDIDYVERMMLPKPSGSASGSAKADDSGEPAADGGGDDDNGSDGSDSGNDGGSDNTGGSSSGNGGSSGDDDDSIG